MELGFAALRSGLIPQDQVDRAKELGDWIKGCYGNPVPVSFVKNNAFEYTIHFKAPVTIDRAMLQEDLSKGQIVRKYNIEYKTTSLDNNNNAAQKKNVYTVFSNGTSIGNKRIDLFRTNITNVYEMKLTILETLDGLRPHIKTFAAFEPCPIK